MAKRKSKSHTTSSLKALIADDDVEFRKILGKMLRNKGFRVTCTGSISDSVNELRNVKFDLIILDMRMPEKDKLRPELDAGLLMTKLLQRVMLTGSDAVVVVFTAYPSVKDFFSVNQAGAYYLPKVVPAVNMTEGLVEECTRMVIEKRRRKSEPKPTWLMQHYDSLVEKFGGKTIAIVESDLAKESKVRGGVVIGNRKIFTARSLKKLQEKILSDPKLRKADPLIVNVMG